MVLVGLLIFVIKQKQGRVRRDEKLKTGFLA